MSTSTKLTLLSESLDCLPKPQPTDAFCTRYCSSTMPPWQSPVAKSAHGQSAACHTHSFLEFYESKAFVIAIAFFRCADAFDGTKLWNCPNKTPAWGRAADADSLTHRCEDLTEISFSILYSFRKSGDVQFALLGVKVAAILFTRRVRKFDLQSTPGARLDFKAIQRQSRQGRFLQSRNMKSAKVIFQRWSKKLAGVVYCK